MLNTVLPQPLSSFRLVQIVVVAENKTCHETWAKVFQVGNRKTTHHYSSLKKAVRHAHHSSQKLLYIVEVAPQDGSNLIVLQTIRNLGHRIMLVSSRSDNIAIKVALATRIPIFVTKQHISPSYCLEGERRTFFPLTGRETNVLQLVANGNSNKDIGAQLSLSTLTIKSHLTKIGRKLGAKNRAHMVAIGLRANIIV